MKLKIDLPDDLADALIRSAGDERRPIPMHAEVLLRRVLGLDAPRAPVRPGWDEVLRRLDCQTGAGVFAANALRRAHVYTSVNGIGGPMREVLTPREALARRQDWYVSGFGARSLARFAAVVDDQEQDELTVGPGQG